MGLLRTRRGVTLLAFATVMTVACVLLGLWQLDRYEQRGDRNDAVRVALATDPVPLQDVLPVRDADDGSPAPQVAGEVEWRAVDVRGTYDPSREVVLRLRPLDGQSSVHVLTPLVLDDGRAVLVDRGFLTTSSPTTEDVTTPTAVGGVVELTGRVRLSEDGRGSGLAAQSTPPSIRLVDLDDLRKVWDDRLATVWLERIDQVPQEDAALTPIPPPELSAGTSLIYAVQWFLFGVIAVVGAALLARRDTRDTSHQTV